MSFQGEDVTIRGSQDAGEGWISCFGQVCRQFSQPFSTWASR